VTRSPGDRDRGRAARARAAASPVTGPVPVAAGDTRLRVTLAAASCALVSLPFLAVSYPPITDLPQHVAQVRLFLETLGQPESPYVIQWLTPYGLVYALLGATWLLFGPADAGRLGMLAVALLSVGATHLLAARRGRPPQAAVLASVLLFNHGLYWGFASFALGWPVFVLWLLVTADPRVRSIRRADLVLVPATACLLYLTHALWLAVALGWLAVDGLVRRLPPRTLAGRLALTTPVALLGLVWLAGAPPSTLHTPTLRGPTPLGRLAPDWLVDATLGGLTGLLEPLVLLVLVAWLLAALAAAGGARWRLTDHTLLGVAILLLTLALLLPHRYLNTIRLGERWMPFALMLALLAAPPLRVPARLAGGAALIVLALFCLGTTLVWTTFERTALTGLPGALGALPPAPRVVGLAFGRSSPLLKTQPFVQTFAHAQVLRGGELSFSFAEFRHALVAYRTPRRPPWTPALEWLPGAVQPSDLLHFDHAIVGGSAALHARLPAELPVTPVTTAGIWRLYRVRKAAAG
jgi:hypothetical protein